MVVVRSSALTLVFQLVLLQILSTHGVQAFGTEYWWGKPYQPLIDYTTIAFYSKCSNATYQTEVNKEARSLKTLETVLYVAQDDSEDTNHIEVEDICNNTNLLLQTLVDLLLQEEYFFPPKLNNKTNHLVWRHSNIGYIFAIVPDAMSTLIQYYFSFTDVLKVCGLQKCDPRLILRSVNDQVLIIKSLLERFEWRNVLFVNVLVKLDDYDFWDTYFNKTIDLLEESKTFCLKTKRVYNSICIDYTKESRNRSIIGLKAFFKNAIASNSTAIVFYGSVKFVSSLFYRHLEEFFLLNFPQNPIIFPHLNHKATFSDAYKPSDWIRPLG